jgi:ZIP family zinc transporter
MIGFDMDISFTQFMVAFGITAAAGLVTVLGSILVFTSRVPSPRLLAFGLSFAGGAMVFISLSEILNKSIQSFSLDYGDKIGFSYGTLSFLAGILLIAFIDHFIPNPHDTLDEHKAQHINQEHIKRVGLMTVLAITAHNFPEGLATFFATLENPQIGLPLALAIALHNIPEGISIAIPIYFATHSKSKALIACFISGLAEPIGALIGYGLLAPFLSDAVFGGVFGVIAGIMVFLALDELLPAAKRYAKGHETVYGLVSGMVIMALSLILFKL